MTLASRVADTETKRRVMYAGMAISGAVFVSTLVLPVSTSVAQLTAALSFGVMSGFWLGHLVHSR